MLASSEEAQNPLTETNATDNFYSTEIKPCFDSDAADENPSTKTMQQRQAILAGIIGTVLLVGSIVSYVLKMHAIAVVGGIIGSACISFALYNILKPNAKLEKVESVEQSTIAHPPLNPT